MFVLARHTVIFLSEEVCAVVGLPGIIVVRDSFGYTLFRAAAMSQRH
jgi:hypothetical protein